MPRNFGGLYKHKVDAKGRVSLPARLRRVVEGNGAGEEVVMVMSDDQTHMLAFLESELDRRLEIMQSSDDPSALPTSRRDPRRASMFGRSSSSQIDSAGRIALYKPYMKKCAIEKECVFEGMGDFFIIYEPARYEAMMQEEIAGFSLHEELGLAA
ncbi:MAG: hypothetical protein AAF221_11115 [Pseudomonadota bacterium]